jgi:phosphatidylglycerophosphate synthase
MFTEPLSFPLFALPARSRYNCVEEESVGDGRRVLSPSTTCPLVFALVPSFATRLRSTTRIERWSLVNAVAVLLAAVGTVWLRALDPILIVGVAMLGGLVGIERARWTPHGTFGVANGVTALRVCLLGLLTPAASVGPWPLVVLSLLFLGLDGLDGWLARRYHLSSSFGAFFDKETDALFLLLLCGLAAFRGVLPLWIVGAGLLRYGFVVVLFLLPTPRKTESRSSLARYVFGTMAGALLASFLLPPGLSRPLVAVATAALLVSFGRSLWGIVAPQWVLRES